MQQYPTSPGDTARQAVYERVSPEGQRISVLAPEQLEGIAAARAHSAAAAADPVYNGADAKRRLHP